MNFLSFDWSSLLDPATEIAQEIAKAKAKGLAESALSGIASSWKKVDGAKERDLYLSNLVENLNTTKVLGNPTPISIDKIYTDVYVFDRLSALRLFSGDIDQIQSNIYETFQNCDRLPALKIAEDGENLFILGKPGAGKTTFLKYLAILSARGEISRTPIFISLKDWSDSSLSIIPYICKQFDICGFPSAEPFVLALLKSGRAIILLDGLDEVNELQNKRTQTIKEIVALAAKFKGCQYCVTCRTAASDYSFEQFKYLEVADFNKEQQDQFVTQWYGHEKEHQLSLFRAGWNDSQQQGLRDLGRTPLLLTLLCLAFDETLRFPVRQVDLYREAIDALLRKWDTSRLILRDDFYRDLSYSRREHLLETVAAKFYFDSRTAFRRSELEAVIIDFLRRLPDKEKSEDTDASLVIRQIEAQHGLIVERASSVFSFSHLTIQEYFTAAHLVKSQDPKLLDQVIKIALQDQKWREVILYTVGLRPSADAILTRMSANLKEMRGTDEGVFYFLGHCMCSARLKKQRASMPEPRLGYRSLSEIKESIETKISGTGHPALTIAETAKIAEHISKINSFLSLRKDKYEFGLAADIIEAAANLLAKTPSKAARLLGGYFSRPDNFISYLYACRLMIECLEVAVTTQRARHLGSIMSLDDSDLMKLARDS